MKQATSQVTLLVGPQTRLARSLNDAVRTRRKAIAEADVTAIPNRIAMRALRAASVEELDNDERRVSLASSLSLGDGRPVFLSAINLLGSPTAAYRRQVLFPNAERMLADQSAAISTMVARIVVTIEPLHHFLLSLSSPTLHQRVADSSWETLYELGWSDLVSDLCAAFPSSRVLVITPDAAFVGARAVLSELFGAAGAKIDPGLLQRPLLTPTGQAALGKIRETRELAPDMLEGLFAAFRDTPDPAELEARMGIDKLTSTLLDQRFREDLLEIERLPNVRLL
jgi:hypothetical protein